MEGNCDVSITVTLLDVHEVNYHSRIKHHVISCPAEGGTQPLSESF